MAECDRCSVFVGSETGLLKGIDVEKKKWSNLNSIDEVNRENEINIMCWDNEEETKICAGTRSQVVTVYDTTTQHFERVDCSGGNGPFRGLGRIERNLLTCTESGLVKLWKEAADEQFQFEVGPDVYRMKQRADMKNVFATGGKENDLKVYDLENGDTQPIFRAKNVRDDWLCLRVPVWITDIEFVPNSQRIVTATGHHQVRMYDPLTTQRRPVLDMTFDEHPITTMSLRPGGNQVIVGNSQGSLALLDLRGKGHMVQRYKGFAGSVRCLQCHPQANIVAACGLDRFVRIYDLDSKSLLQKFYLKSRLNCVLMTSSWPGTEDSSSLSGAQVADKDGTSVEGKGNRDEDEVLWDSLPVVHTKKLKRKPKHEKFETDVSEIGISGRVKKKKLSAKNSNHELSTVKVKPSRTRRKKNKESKEDL